jgi:hypothetical protein
MVDLLRSVGSGERGGPPASIVMLGGDVHHAYLAEVAFHRDDGVTAPVWQAVCSPFRNPLDARERRVIKAAGTRAAYAITRLLARAARVPDPRIRWRLCDKPTFDFLFATIDIDGRRAELRIEKTPPGDWRHPRIETSLARRLA